MPRRLHTLKKKKKKVLLQRYKNEELQIGLLESRAHEKSTKERQINLLSKAKYFSLSAEIHVPIF